MHARNVTVLIGCAGLVACGGMGKKDESVSLAPAGIDLNVNLPTGGKLKKEGAGAEVTWVGASFIASFALDGTHLVTKRDAVARDASGAYEGTQPVTVAGKAFACTARAKAQADAERLMVACDALAAASPKAATATLNGAVAATAAPIELEERTLAVKSPLKSGFNITARVPKGWATSDQLGTTLVKDPAPSSPNAISVTFAAFDGVKTLADAEREAKRLDVAGLDVIGDKRELAAGKFLVATAPRGLLKLTTVRVFARGKKGTALATCSGPGKRKADLEQICSSATAE